MREYLQIEVKSDLVVELGSYQKRSQATGFILGKKWVRLDDFEGSGDLMTSMVEGHWTRKGLHRR